MRSGSSVMLWRVGFSVFVLGAFLCPFNLSFYSSMCRYININEENNKIEYEYVVALWTMTAKRNGILEASSRRNAVAVITWTPVGFVPTEAPLVTSLHPLPLPHSIHPVHGSDTSYFRVRLKYPRMYLCIIVFP